MGIITDQKIPTDIIGLDRLFFDGIQLRQFKRVINENGQEQKKTSQEEEDNLRGLVIIVKGPRGVDKTLFVMQLMHGLTKHIRSFWDAGTKTPNPHFYSLNKPTMQLMDMLLDTLISKMVYQITKEHLKGNLTSEDSTFCNYIFETNNAMPFCKKDNGSAKKNIIKDLHDISHSNLLDKYPTDLLDKLDKYLAEEIVYYNNRTNALHIRRNSNSDDKTNLLFNRKYDEIEKYCNNDEFGKLPSLFKEELFPVDFNLHTQKKGGDKNYNFSYSSSALHNFKSMLNNIEEHTGENIPCIVLDGITQLGLEDLHNINFSHMERVFRQKALVSILVFDDTEDTTKCNADIVIEMRRIEDKDVNYSYHQLRISKCVFQQVAYGWHQYKKRDYGIEVYPSSHFLIQKRRHMVKMLRTAHADILEENYEKYLKNYNNKREDKEDGESYRTYSSQTESAEWERLRKLSLIYANKKKDDDGYEQEVLRNILHYKHKSGKESTVKKPLVTAVIGLPNTYKRFLATGYAFSSCAQKQNTLYTLLDKDEQTMLGQMVCPGMMNKKECENKCEKECNSFCGDNNCKLIKCRECYKYIHFFEIRMGCIGSDEFFHYLKEEINLAKEEEKIKRIVVDDLQKIDYSFPFLEKDKLFLTTLISLCKDNDVDLLILCDEKAHLKDELMALADNIIRTERKIDEKAECSVTLHVEKYVENYKASHTYSYEVADIREAFICDPPYEGLKINDKDKENKVITVVKGGKSKQDV